MKAACGYYYSPSSSEGTLHEVTPQKLSVHPPRPDPDTYICLVAAKVLYFGVGGSVSEFVRAVEGSNNRKKNGRVETVWEKRAGVARSIMRVYWD